MVRVSDTKTHTSQQKLEDFVSRTDAVVLSRINQSRFLKLFKI